MTESLRDVLAREAAEAEARADAENRGGIPPTAGQRGRRRSKDPGQVYAVRIPVSRLRELRVVADALGRAPSSLIRQWVLERLDTLKDEASPDTSVLAGTSGPASFLTTLATGRAPHMGDSETQQDGPTELHLADRIEATTSSHLKDLLSSVSVEVMRGVGMSPQLALALRRGQRPISPDQAAALAPLAGTTPEALLRSNPPLPEDIVRDLDAVESREWVRRLAQHRTMTLEEARLVVGYGVYALAARETEKGQVDWKARIIRYAQAVLGDEHQH